MCTLAIFQPPLTSGYVTICEQRGEFISVPEKQDIEEIRSKQVNRVMYT